MKSKSHQKYLKIILIFYFRTDHVTELINNQYLAKIYIKVDKEYSNTLQRMKYENF